jgi:hypothetical protein
MRLPQQYQPVTLDDVVGQPAVVRRLKRLVAAPFVCCLLFEGKGGVGKIRRLYAQGLCPLVSTQIRCGSRQAVATVALMGRVRLVCVLGREGLTTPPGGVNSTRTPLLDAAANWG